MSNCKKGPFIRSQQKKSGSTNQQPKLTIPHLEKRKASEHLRIQQAINNQKLKVEQMLALVAANKVSVDKLKAALAAAQEHGARARISTQASASAAIEFAKLGVDLKRETSNFTLPTEL